MFVFAVVLTAGPCWTMLFVCVKLCCVSAAEDSQDEALGGRRGSIESTVSERDFRNRFTYITHRMVHRKVAGEMYRRRLASEPIECDKTVNVRRGSGEFGLRVHGARPVVVASVEPESPALTSGLEVGDILISVNGVNVLESPHSEVIRIAHAGLFCSSVCLAFRRFSTL